MQTQQRMPQLGSVSRLWSNLWRTLHCYPAPAIGRTSSVEIGNLLPTDRSCHRYCGVSFPSTDPIHRRSGVLDIWIASPGCMPLPHDRCSEDGQPLSDATSVTSLPGCIIHAPQVLLLDQGLHPS